MNSPLTVKRLKIYLDKLPENTAIFTAQNGVFDIVNYFDDIFYTHYIEYSNLRTKLKDPKEENYIARKVLVINGDL